MTTDYERGKRDGTEEALKDAAKVVASKLITKGLTDPLYVEGWNRAVDYCAAILRSRADEIAALPVPGQPEKEGGRWYASSPRFFRPEEGSET